MGPEVNAELRVKYRRKDIEVGAQARGRHLSLSTPWAEAGESL